MSDSYDEEFIKYLELSNRAEEFTSSLGTFSQDEDEIDNVKFINPSFNLTDFVELVIFYGPPCSSKTPTYFNFYKDTHVRISIAEWINKGNSLHKAVQYCIKLLMDGKSVVIDDCCTKKRLRLSFINPIKQKIKNIRIVGIEFSPIGGIEQCKYVSQWAKFTNGNPEYEPQQILKKCKNFELEKDSLNLKDESYDLIKIIQPKPYCISKKFFRSALIIDSSSIFSFTKLENSDIDFKLEFNNAIKKIMHQWNTEISNGIIVIIIEDYILLPSKVELEKDSPDLQSHIIQSCHKQIFKALDILKEEFTFYVVWTQYETQDIDSYLLLPSPGIFSWIQWKLKIDLTKSYCFTDKAFNDLLNLKYIKARESLQKGFFNLQHEVYEGKGKLKFLDLLSFNDDIKDITYELENLKDETIDFGRYFYVYNKVISPNQTRNISKRKGYDDMNTSPTQRKLPAWMR